MSDSGLLSATQLA